MNVPDFAPRFDTDLVRPFWEALQRGELHLPACSRCGAWQWYPYEFVRCHAEARHEWRQVATTGSVFTFTTVHRNFLPGANDSTVPYVSALVEIDGVVGPRIATVLINLAGREPHIGMRVRLHPLPRTGYTAPTFEPL
jgi:uncharacterized OB-fold protein